MNQFNPAPILPAIAPGKTQTFGVIIRFQQQQREQRIHYEIQVTCKKQLGDGSFLFELNRDQVYINGKAPDTLIDQLADACGKILYPLQVAVTPDNRLFGIVNTADIQARWTTAKTQIAQYYQGSIADDTLQYMQLAVQNHRHVQAAILQDWFMAAYFLPRPKRNEAGTAWQLPLMPYCAPLAFTAYGNYTAPGENNDYHILEQTAECIDERGAEDLQRGYPTALSRHLTGRHTPVQATAHVTTRLYKNGTVQSITGTAQLALPGEEGQAVSLEIYHLSERDIQPAAVSLPDENAQKETGKRKFSFSLFR